ncbi:MAG TPA: cytochrome P450 [Rubricoccaceae bacterium]
MPASPPRPVPLDVRTYESRRPGDLLVAFARDLLTGIGRLDAVGGDAVWARPPVGSGVVLLRHPDLVRAVLVENNDDVTKARGLRLASQILGQGLLTSEVPVHTRQRRLVLPAFHHQKLRGYAATMVEQSVAEAQRWTSGTPFDVAAAMNRLALAIAGRTLFGADVLEHAGTVSNALAETLAGFDRSQFPLADKLAWIPRPAVRRTMRARATLDALVYGLIAERRAQGTEGRDDLLSILIDARDEDTGEAMTDREVRDEALTLLLAGHETTAVALAWTFALLAQNPEAEARLHAEVDALPGDPTFESLAALPVTRLIVSESMRLRPPAWTVGREAARATELAGMPVPRGTTILFSPFFLHRDPRFWARPRVFNPDRFAPEARAARHKFAYIPFSAGRRGCIGEQFAWTEAVLVLATLARRWQLRPAGPVPEPHGSVTLRPKGPMRMTAEVRGV